MGALLALDAIALRDSVTAYAVGNGLERIERGPVVNGVDPRAFNYSIEEPLLRHYGSLTALDRPWRFSVVQPCIRAADFDRLIKRGEPTTSVFDMAAIDYQVCCDPNAVAEVHYAAVVRWIRWLTEEVGLRASSLRLTCYEGGSIAAASRGRYCLAQEFGPDTVSADAAREAGVGIVDEVCGLETFLIDFPAPVEFHAGYRFELFYRDDASCDWLEIGTGESLTYRRRLHNGRVTAIEPAESAIVAIAIGIERLLMAGLRLSSPYECPHIAPLVEEVVRQTGRQQRAKVLQLVDALRTVHLVVADGFGYAALPSRHLRHQFNDYLSTLLRTAELCGLDEAALAQLVRLNAALQPWYNSLAGCDEAVHREVELYRNRSASWRRNARG